jgi:2-methylcitrate dehydratase PrpD
VAVAASSRDDAPAATLGDALAAWAVSRSFLPSPSAVRHAAKRCILDATGCAIAAGTVPPMPALLALAPAPLERGRCTLLFAPGRFDAASAAELNAAAAHALDFDDTFYAGLAHVTAAVWPAVLAVAQAERASGARALDAFIAGVEAAYALGKGFGNALYLERGWWTTAYFGAVGAAVGCASLLQLDRHAARSAVGLAASGSIVVRALLGSNAKPYRCGASARDGLRAALAARKGVRGPDHVFEHALGVIPSLAGGRFDAEFVQRLGKDWSLVDPGVAFKRYPLCSAAQAAVQATLEILDEANADTSAIDAIECSVPPLVALSLIYPDPYEPSQAQFSLAFAVACAALHGDIAPAHLTQAVLDDPALRALMARVRQVTRPDIDFGLDGPEGAQVAIRWANGRESVRRVVAARGMPADPATDDELLAKFLRNAGSAADAQALAERLLALEAQADCDAIGYDALQEATAS